MSFKATLPGLVGVASDIAYDFEATAHPTSSAAITPATLAKLLGVQPTVRQQKSRRATSRTDARTLITADVTAISKWDKALCEWEEITAVPATGEAYCAAATKTACVVIAVGGHWDIVALTEHLMLLRTTIRATMRCEAIAPRAARFDDEYGDSWRVDFSCAADITAFFSSVASVRVRASILAHVEASAGRRGLDGDAAVAVAMDLVPANDFTTAPLRVGDIAGVFYRVWTYDGGNNNGAAVKRLTPEQMFDDCTPGPVLAHVEGKVFSVRVAAGSDGSTAAAAASSTADQPPSMIREICNGMRKGAVRVALLPPAVALRGPGLYVAVEVALHRCKISSANKTSVALPASLDLTLLSALQLATMRDDEVGVYDEEQLRRITTFHGIEQKILKWKGVHLHTQEIDELRSKVTALFDAEITRKASMKEQRTVDAAAVVAEAAKAAVAAECIEAEIDRAAVAEAPTHTRPTTERAASSSSSLRSDANRRLYEACQRAREEGREEARRAIEGKVRALKQRLQGEVTRARKSEAAALAQLAQTQTELEVATTSLAAPSSAALSKPLIRKLKRQLAEERASLKARWEAERAEIIAQGRDAVSRTRAKTDAARAQVRFGGCIFVRE